MSGSFVRDGAPGVALVSGAAEGIGWATAQRLARDGLRVVLVDLNEDGVKQRARELGPDHGAFACDVTCEADVQALVPAVEATLGPLTVLVNNAGIPDQTVPTLSQQVEAFDRVLDVHLRGTFLLSREAARVMAARGHGAIVNLSSVVASGGVPGRNAYSAAKAGISAMTRAMACEWARQGLRVNAVAPGYVRTALVARLEQAGTVDTARIAARTPMGRLAQPEEIANVIAFLASSGASYITGVTLPVDGGWLAFAAPEAVLAA